MRRSLRSCECGKIRSTGNQENENGTTTDCSNGEYNEVNMKYCDLCVCRDLPLVRLLQDGVDVGHIMLLRERPLHVPLSDDI